MGCKKKFKFEIGDRTQEVWAGDLISTCEYIGNLGLGQMLFYDITFKYFRRVFIEMDNNIPILNGWKCAYCPSELL